MTLLELEDVWSGYGSIVAVKGVSLRVDPGEIVTLIGANGAGKTTTLRTVSGLLRVQRGRISFDGRDITRTAPHAIVKLGIAQSPEGRGIFSRLSVRENLEMGAYTRTGREMEADLEHVLELFPRLRERVGQAGGTLSGGEQQMLAIGRALMARPRLLLLDEPSMGLAPVLVQVIFKAIREIQRERQMTILLVEQNANAALKIADRGYVLESGAVVAEALAAQLATNQAVRNAYLGA